MCLCLSLSLYIYIYINVQTNIQIYTHMHAPLRAGSATAGEAAAPPSILLITITVNHANDTVNTIDNNSINVNRYIIDININTPSFGHATRNQAGFTSRSERPFRCTNTAALKTSCDSTCTQTGLNPSLPCSHLTFLSHVMWRDVT